MTAHIFAVNVFERASNNTPSQALSSTDVLLPFGLFASAAIILGIAVTILWIWALISIISLNARFKDFYLVYMESNHPANDEDVVQPPRREQVTIKPIEHEAKDNSRLSQNLTKPISNRTFITTIALSLATAAILVIMLTFGPK